PQQLETGFGAGAVRARERQRGEPPERVEPPARGTSERAPGGFPVAVGSRGGIERVPERRQIGSERLRGGPPHHLPAGEARDPEARTRPRPGGRPGAFLDRLRRRAQGPVRRHGRGAGREQREYQNGSESPEAHALTPTRWW